jgi:hypothetical protein
MTTEPQRVILIDEPTPYDTLETWERHLTKLEALPANTFMRAELIKRAKSLIADQLVADRSTW